MKLVLERGILVARHATQRLDFFLVRQVVHVEPSMTRHAYKSAVSRGSQYRIADKQRYWFAFPLHREGLIAVTGQTVRLGLREERRGKKQKRPEKTSWNESENQDAGDRHFFS